MYCQYCGKEIADDAVVCPSCGRQARPLQQATPTALDRPKSRMVAGMLAFFLGGVGIHKFYLERPGSGILYLLFCWTFIPAIIALFEALGFFLMSDVEFSARYNAPPEPEKPEGML